MFILTESLTMLTQEEKINFRQQREFGDRISLTLNFLRQNFQPLGKALLVIAGPVSLVVGIIYSQFFDQVLSFQQGSEPDINEVVNSLSSASLAAMLSFLSVALVMTTTFEYQKLYMEREDLSDPITVTEVWNQVVKSVGWIVLAIIVYAILVGLGLFVFVIPGIALTIYLALAFPLTVFERSNLAFSRSLKLVQNNWWSTFGFLIIISILQSIFGLVFQFPVLITSFFQALHTIDEGAFNKPDSLFSSVSYTISYLGGQLLYSLTAVALAVQYFHLVEKNEARGLVDRIDQVGN